MKHFESHNNESIVTINDTDSCLYLKYKISLKGMPIKPSIEVAQYKYYGYNGDGIIYGIRRTSNGDIYQSNLYNSI